MSEMAYLTKAAQSLKMSSIRNENDQERALERWSAQAQATCSSSADEAACLSGASDVYRRILAPSHSPNLDYALPWTEESAAAPAAAPAAKKAVMAKAAKAAKAPKLPKVKKAKAGKSKSKSKGKSKYTPYSGDVAGFRDDGSSAYGD